jgi:hypothetical protein
MTRATSEHLVRHVGQAVEINDIVVQVVAVHPNGYVQLRIDGPVGMHLAAEWNLKRLLARCKVETTSGGWVVLSDRSLPADTGDQAAGAPGAGSRESPPALRIPRH